MPTAVTYASPQAAVRRRLRQMLETSYYRVEESADQRGLELCSALKNAYAIAIGAGGPQPTREPAQPVRVSP